VNVSWEWTSDYATFTQRMATQPLQLFNLAWNADYPDPDSFLRASTFRRESRWRHEVYDRLVEEARRVPEWEERSGLYSQVERILLEEVPILPLHYHREYLLIKPWVTRYPASTAGLHFWEEVVLEPH
jgi:ABC-type oligopeptide transport system substrate-binding subunit